MQQIQSITSMWSDNDDCYSTPLCRPSTRYQCYRGQKPLWCEHSLRYKFGHVTNINNHDMLCSLILFNKAVVNASIHSAFISNSAFASSVSIFRWDGFFLQLRGWTVFTWLNAQSDLSHKGRTCLQAEVSGPCTAKLGDRRWLSKGWHIPVHYVQGKGILAVGGRLH